MPPDCGAAWFGFGTVEGRSVVAGFDGGAITSDAGALRLGATDRAIRLGERFASRFIDGRRQEARRAGRAPLAGKVGSRRASALGGQHAQPARACAGRSGSLSQDRP